MAEVALLVGERSGRHAGQQASGGEPARGRGGIAAGQFSARSRVCAVVLLGIKRARLKPLPRHSVFPTCVVAMTAPRSNRLAGASPTPLASIAGATRRTGLREAFFPSSSTRGLRKLDAWVERALLEKDEGWRLPLPWLPRRCARICHHSLPKWSARALRIGRLPRDLSASGEIARVVRVGRQLPLPPWLPA